MKPLYVVRHVATSERIACVNAIRQQVPELIVVEDKHNDPMGTFCKALSYDASRPIVQLEDDIELCNHFVDILAHRVNDAPHAIINFFGHCGSKRTKSKWQKGKYFLWLQCTYFPAGYGNMIAEYWPTWRDVDSHKFTRTFPADWYYKAETLFDRMVGAWLTSRDESYYISLPALVQHLPITSVIDPRLPVNRQNQTFTKAVKI